MENFLQLRLLDGSLVWFDREDILHRMLPMLAPNILECKRITWNSDLTESTETAYSIPAFQEQDYGMSF